MPSPSAVRGRYVVIIGLVGGGVSAILAALTQMMIGQWNIIGSLFVGTWTAMGTILILTFRKQTQPWLVKHPWLSSAVIALWFWLAIVVDWQLAEPKAVQHTLLVSTILATLAFLVGGATLRTSRNTAEMRQRPSEYIVAILLASRPAGLAVGTSTAAIAAVGCLTFAVAATLSEIDSWKHRKSGDGHKRPQ